MLNLRAVTESMYYGLRSSLANKAYVFMNYTSSLKTHLNPNTIMSTLPEKCFNSRESVSFPNPLSLERGGSPQYP